MAKSVNEQASKSADLSSLSHQLTDMGKHQVDAMMRVQSQFLHDAEERNRMWASRAEAEVALASELFTKLASAKTLPDAVSAYQKCFSERLQLLSQDSARIFEDTEKFLANGIRLFSNSRPGPTT